jgi:hypothetical protein
MFGTEEYSVTQCIFSSLLCLSAFTFIFSRIHIIIMRASSHASFMPFITSSADWHLSPSVIGELNAYVTASVHTTPFISNGVLPVLLCVLLF